MKDAMGDRMKEFYEQPYRIFLTRRTPVIIRIDGKAFHTYTKKAGFQKPFDDTFIDLMNKTAIELCKNIQGAKCAYVQSDEISILVTDYDNINTDAWFGYNIQKMTSVSASIATQYFNKLMADKAITDDLGDMIDLSMETSDKSIDDVPLFIAKYLQSKIEKYSNLPVAHFDSRVFNIPTKEIANYFLWRQQDAVRNSIQAVAQSLYSSKELHGANSDKLQEMIFQKGINWNDFDYGKKRGRFIKKQSREVSYQVFRNEWELVETPLAFSETDFIYFY